MNIFMKVCVISSIFPPFSRGGAETVAYSTAQAFAQEGHEVFVITCAPWSGRESLAGKWEQHNKHRVFSFTPLNLFSVFNIAKYPLLLRLFWHAIDMINPHTYLVVRRLLLQEKPDLILTHNLKGLGYTVHLAIHHSRFNKQFVKQRARWFHTLHDLGALHPTGLKIWGREKSLFQNNPLVALYAWINKKLLGDPDVVISPSQFLLDEYRARGFFPKSRTVVVRNPVGEPSAPEPGFVARDGFIRFIFLGQLEVYKGLRLLLEVWREFSADHKDAELTIAGQGSMQGEVEQAVKRLARAQYVGFLKREEFDELFGGRCVMVLPSLVYENSPTSIGESFASGAPVVASRIGGIPELVEDRINGLLFEPGNAKALQQTMDEAMKKWGALHNGARKSAAEFLMEHYYDTVMSLCGR